MNNSSRWPVLLTLIVAAFACYSIGFVAGFGFFIFVGIIFEAMFWIKLFKHKDKN